MCHQVCGGMGIVRECKCGSSMSVQGEWHEYGGKAVSQGPGVHGHGGSKGAAYMQGGGMPVDGSLMVGLPVRSKYVCHSLLSVCGM
jgi:hypothetical protein